MKEKLHWKLQLFLKQTFCTHREIKKIGNKCDERGQYDAFACTRCYKGLKFYKTKK